MLSHSDRHRCLHRRRRIEEVASTRLIEKFSADEPELTVTADSHGLLLAVGDETYELSRDDALELRDQLADAVTQTHEFVHTTCTHREDGSYVVERRGANSAGHRKVFDSFEACVRLFGRLPDEFTAEDVGRTGLTGGRRHMLVWHYAEHPEFDCELVSRQPLTVAKRDGETADAEHDSTGPRPVGLVEVSPAD